MISILVGIVALVWLAMSGCLVPALINLTEEPRDMEDVFMSVVVALLIPPVLAILVALALVCMLVGALVPQMPARRLA